MFDLSLTVETADFLSRTEALATRHLPQIEVWALNWTADDVLKAVQGRMRVAFDRPTRWTLGAFHVWRATKATRVAVVQERPSVGRRHYLKVQEAGGARPQTALEKLVAMKVVSSQILTAVIPASGARIDAYGNWSRGERNQALSEIRAQRDSAANATAVSIARARRRGRASYFTPKNGGLSPGIWKRTSAGTLSKVAHFVDRSPVYRPAFEFEGTAARAYRERLAPNLQRAFERALATAR